MLIRNCRFTYQDVCLLTAVERNRYITLRVEEAEREKSATESTGRA